MIKFSLITLRVHASKAMQIKFFVQTEKGNFFSINSVGQLHPFLCEKNKTEQNSEHEKERNDVVMKW